MNTFDLITREELDNLPASNLAAFPEFVRIVESRLDAYVSQAGEDEAAWDRVNEARRCFMSVVLSYARITGIDGLPEFENYGKDYGEEFSRFKYRLDSIAASCLFGELQLKKRSEFLPIETAKSKIRTYVASIKDVIDRSNYDEKDKSQLYNALGKFEKALEGKRINLLDVLRVINAVLVIPPAAAVDYTLLRSLTSKIIEIVEEIKTTEDMTLGYADLEMTRQLAAPAPIPIPAPRKKAGRPSDADNGMDDDIPF